MMVVKLIRASTRERRLVEAEEVRLTVVRGNELTQILADGKLFNVANPYRIRSVSDLQATDVKTEELWSEAYIENSAGATTDQVKFTN